MFSLSQYTNLFTASKCSNRQHWILNKTYTHLTFEGRGICKRYLCLCIRYHSLNARWKFFICWVGAFSQSSRININITSYRIAYCVLLLLKLVGWAHLFIKNTTSISPKLCKPLVFGFMYCQTIFWCTLKCFDVYFHFCTTDCYFLMLFALVPTIIM